MTRRKSPRPILTDDDLVRIFTGRAFKDVLAANWPKDAPVDIDHFAKLALEDARIYIRDAVKPDVKTTGRPSRSPVIEAAIDFTMNLQLTYYTATGEQPSFTANRGDPGPLARILGWCLVELNAPPDAVTYINDLQHRSNKMNDDRGRERRKRVRENFKRAPK
jgi:hypothetical protein